MPTKIDKQRARRFPLSRNTEILDVRMAAEFLTVSPDTVYELFKSGQVPARKIGRKWITTKSAVLGWIEDSVETDTAERTLKNGNRDAVAKVLKSGKVRVKGRA